MRGSHARALDPVRPVPHGTSPVKPEARDSSLNRLTAQSVAASVTVRAPIRGKWRFVNRKFAGRRVRNGRARTLHFPLRQPVL